MNFGSKNFNAGEVLRKYFKSQYPEGRYNKKLKVGFNDLRVVGDGVELDSDDKIRYVYLKELWHAEAWVKGGEIPIYVASTYKSDVRDGILTPDENLIYDSPIDVKGKYSPNFLFGNVRGLTMTGCWSDGERIPDMFNVNHYADDGVILSFCKKFDIGIGKRFKGKVICLKILDIHRLFKIIDEQLPVGGRLRDCVYTDDHQRNHFLKSVDDSWQEETRMFWALPKTVSVQLPPGLAEVAGNII